MRAPFRVRRAWVGPTLLGSLVLVVVAAGGAASFETGTVGSFWEGLWWAVSLMTTVGFIGEPPETLAGAALSVVLMLVGFVLLATVSAGLASLFVREDVAPFEAQERQVDRELLSELRELHHRIAALEQRLGAGSSPLGPDEGPVREGLGAVGPPDDGPAEGTPSAS